MLLNHCWFDHASCTYGSKKQASFEAYAKRQNNIHIKIDDRNLLAFFGFYHSTLYNEQKRERESSWKRVYGDHDDIALSVWHSFWLETEEKLHCLILYHAHAGHLTQIYVLELQNRFTVHALLWVTFQDPSCAIIVLYLPTKCCDKDGQIVQ